MEFIIPREAGSSSARLDSCAQLFFVTVHRKRHELPSDFFPGVHRNQIVAAIQQHVPDVQAVEKPGEGACPVSHPERGQEDFEAGK